MLCTESSGGDPVFADSVDKLDTFHDVGERPGFQEPEVETFDPLELLARVIMHIPEPRRHLYL